MCIRLQIAPGFLPVLCVFVPLRRVSFAWGTSSRVSFLCRLDFSTYNQDAHTRADEQTSLVPQITIDGP